jgi:hypothetical protein
MPRRILRYLAPLVNGRLLVSVVVGAAVLAGASAVAATREAAVPHWKAWLCFPNRPHDWCYVGLDTVVVSTAGRLTAMKVSPSSSPPVDCFYVCRMFAPLYRQALGPNGNRALGYADVLAAWKDYLAHDNDGRGVVLIGHSQGASVLETLIHQEIERSSAERRLLVSAILVGGNVLVPNGRLTGGTFSRVLACTSVAETGCVVAYSSWDKTPPADADFEAVAKPGSEHVLCVNPAAPGGGSAPITPLFAGYNFEGIVPPGSPYLRYQWIEFLDLYTARCGQKGPRAWLQVTRTHTAGDPRPTVQEVDQPNEGLHAADINIDLANLVSLVRTEAHAFVSHR